MVELVEHIIDVLENGENVIGVYLDLSKACDCLSHDLILSKLRTLGFHKTAWKWFEGYLTDRNQFVELRQNIKRTVTCFRSQQLPVKRGVPQSSVLGPVIFILFTFDLPMYTDQFSKALMYADDTVLVTSGKDLTDLEFRSNIALKQARDYCNSNDLVFNETKTKQLNMGSKKEEISGIHNLEVVKSTSHLGLIIDDRLNWTNHIDELSKKLSTAIFALRRVKAISTLEAVKTTYHSLFESRLRYGIVLWGSTYHYNIERVLVLQKKAIRVMADLDWGETCRDAFLQWRILTVVNIYLMEVIHFACSKGLPRNESMHDYNTRHARDFSLPIHHSKKYETKPSYVGAKFFNILPEEVKRSSPEKLKTKLQEWLLKHPFYSLKEFMDFKNCDVI